MKVLVVEDDIEINELIGEYLGLENIEYLQATSGKSGIHLATEHHPDAIVLDLMLPDIDGFEVARALATHRATYDIPIVILTCMCHEGDREKGFSAGALFYMNKPFLPDDLLARLREGFAWRAQLRSRAPAGTVMLGAKDVTVCPRAINQMVADLFTRTELSEGSVGQIREAVETLGQWALRWNQDHQSQTQVRLDYRVMEAGVNGNGVSGAAGVGGVEWKLSEGEPGMLAEAFFKAGSAAKTVGGGGGGGLMGWGGAILPLKGVLGGAGAGGGTGGSAGGAGGVGQGAGGAGGGAGVGPPGAWLQVLAKTGAVRFEKDSATRTVRFVRGSGEAVNGSAVGAVPVVEIDGTRYPTRVRDEAMGGKRG